MFGIDECEKFRTATMAHTLPTGLCDQPAGFLQQYPGLFLILKLYALKFHGFSDKMNETLRFWEMFRQEKFDVFISEEEENE